MQNIANVDLKEAILADVEYDELAECITEHRALYETMEEEIPKDICAINECDELPVDGKCFCKRHQTMINRIVFGNAENAVPIHITCAGGCDDCPDVMKVKRVNVIVKLLQSYKDNDDEKKKLMVKEIHSDSINKRQFEFIYRSIIERIKVEEGFEEIEDNMEKGIIDEGTYIQQCYETKLIYEMQNTD